MRAGQEPSRALTFVLTVSPQIMAKPAHVPFRDTIRHGPTTTGNTFQPQLDLDKMNRNSVTMRGMKKLTKAMENSNQPLMNSA